VHVIPKVFNKFYLLNGKVAITKSPYSRPFERSVCGFLSTILDFSKEAWVTISIFHCREALCIRALNFQEFCSAESSFTRPSGDAPSQGTEGLTTSPHLCTVKPILEQYAFLAFTSF